MTSCAIVFEHEFTSETLHCVKTNNLNDLNKTTSNYSMSTSLLNESIPQFETTQIRSSKIISIQTLHGNLIYHFV